MRDLDHYKNRKKAHRRDWLTEEWNDDVLQHVIRPLCKIPFELVKPVQDEMIHWEYPPFHSVLNVTRWVESDAVNALKDFFSKYKFIDDHIAFYSPPDHIIKPHRDPIRGAGIYIPMLPDDYPPLEMYYNNEMLSTPLQTEDNFIAYLWNPQILHGVFNMPCNRYNLQMSISIPYNDYIQGQHHV